MTVGISSAELAIRAEIALRGPISFARFMQLALYSPGIGYYRENRERFGCAGDFYTAGQLQPVFGDTLVEYVRMIAPLQHQEPFTVCELGAGRRDLQPALARWNYIGFDWNQDELPRELKGLVIANEFLDALPVRVFKKRQDGWREILVSWNCKFLFVEAACHPEDIAHGYLDQYGAATPIGGVIEMNTEMRDWLLRVGAMLRSGRLLVIDYGYSQNELPRFPVGTVVGYEGHVAMEDVLSNAGNRDITAHVNFSELRSIAADSGFYVETDTSLRDWVLSIWPEEKLAARWAQADLRWRLQWKKLVFEMGAVFRVLILRRDEAGAK